MPEAAGRSLEDILASIRQSLADETVDGLVELSAAAAAAARAEARQGVGTKAEAPFAVPHDAALPEEDDAQSLLTGKLAGALKAEDEAGDDLSDLLAEHHGAPEENTEATAVPPEGDHALSKMWFLRPGAPEVPPPSSEPAEASSVLSLDPFAQAGLPSTGAEANGGAFAQSARALGAGAASGEPTVSTVSTALDAPTPKLNVPRLDREKIELIKKLKASSAAAVESIEKTADIVDLRTPAVPHLEVPADPVPAKEPGLPEVDSAAKLLLVRPERSTPLFGGDTDQRRPIVSSPLAVSMLLPQQDEVPAPSLDAETVHVPKATPVAADLPSASDVLVAREHDADLDDVFAPDVQDEEVVPAEAAEDVPDMPSDDAATAPYPAAALMSQFQTAKTVASVLPPSPPPAPAVPPSPVMAADFAAAQGNRPLEDMIATMLEPVMQRLLEKNLGPMLEALVRKEVEKALKDRRDG